LHLREKRCIEECAMEVLMTVKSLCATKRGKSHILIGLQYIASAWNERVASLTLFCVNARLHFNGRNRLC
jgi:hypothetical protein